ncbi:LacI family transcriptional regulator [Pseudoclavibacter chungangensis]|nr:LacI family DNA-binding transcriptional regulator [Pseudoclavibacter chungangensis]NYJ68616.1 LacI family transcriptional regulator [Pseudoclavibacter chungangensis]
MRDRRPTLRDVARAAGISSAQASMALNGTGRVSAATAARVKEIAQELGYSPNPTARALRTGNTATFGLVVRNLPNSYFLDVIRGMDDVCAESGATLLIMESEYDHTQEHTAVERMAKSGVSGLAIAPIGGGTALDWWREHAPGTPLVLLNSAPHDEFVTIGPDGPLAVEQALGEFRRLGHRRVAFVGAPVALQADTDRAARFTELCDAWDMQGELVESWLTFDAIEHTIGALLDRPDGPRAFLMNSDYTASAVYVAARERGLRIGYDVSVIGHDAIPTSQLLAPPLTTIGVDRREVGRAAAGALVTLLDGGRPRNGLLPTALVAGSSVADHSADSADTHA